MKPDASDVDGAARKSLPTKEPAGRQGHGQYPGYWPAWLVSGIAIIFTAVQFLCLPATPEIDFSGLIAEAVICLIPLSGLFVVQRLRQSPRIYWPMIGGLSFLLLSHLIDALDEVRVQPEIVGILIEDGMAVLGYALLVFGLVRWVRFNHRLLAEIQALNTDLERRVTDRTAMLEGEITERRQAEERLRDSEQRYRELNAGLEQRVAQRTAEVQAASALLQEREEGLQFILEGSRLGAWDWNIATGEVKRNDYWAAMLGYSLEEVDDATTHGWLALVHPDDRERAWQSIDDHLSGRTPLHEVEYRMRARDGSYRWILDRARIVCRDGEGRPQRMSGTHEDITSRKQTQQALEESHQRLLTVLNAMDAYIYLADMDTHDILFMNKPLLRACGPREGQPCYRVLQGLDAPCTFCTNDHLLNTDGCPSGVYAWEFQNRLNHRWYDLRDCAVRWTDGRLVRMEIATDITERKQIELRLRQSEERFRLVAEHALDNIWTMGPDYRMRYLSPSIQTLTGYTVEEYLVLTLEDWLMPGSQAVAAAYFTALDERRAAGLSVADYPFRGEIELKTKNGKGIWTEIIVTPLVDGEGRMTELSGVTRDIRERKRYEAELERSRQAAEAANAAKTAFLAHMSHEIRTPMSGIIGMAELMLRTALGEQQRNYCQKIAASATALLGILNDILDFSKIEAGKLQLEMALFDLRQLIDQVINLVEFTAQDKHLSLTVDYAPGLGRRFVGDSLRITQVLTNLLSNAIKFTAVGTVSLGIHRPAAERLRFEVRDTGIGLTAEEQQRLFQAFSQADSRTTRKYGGTGLGLAISKRLVELMGGTIEVTSEPGRGSCFSFEIDAQEGAAPNSGPIGGQPEPVSPEAGHESNLLAGLGGQRLLLVEDNAIIREIVLGFLEGSDLFIETAENGQQAVERCQQSPWDLILMDIQMPVMDGFEATRCIRALDPAVPIIALTANAFKEDIAATQAAGMNEHLSKPISMNQLHRVLRKYLQPSPDRASHAPPSSVTVPPTVTASTDDFPEIAGIDRHRAALTLGQDRALFLRLLGRFADECADTVTLAGQALARGERETAARRLHTLRGTAGYLGALDLMRATGDLEQAIATGATGLAVRLEALGDQVDALIAASAPWRLPAGPPPMAETGTSIPLDPEQLERLRLALYLQKGRARRIFQQLEPALQGVLGSADMQTLGQAIRDLRFDQALAILEPLILERVVQPQMNANRRE